ncbi:MAG: hypothetical protein ACI3XP_03250, partial [Eubacteriales bacterium]
MKKVFPGPLSKTFGQKQGYRTVKSVRYPCFQVESFRCTLARRTASGGMAGGFRCTLAVIQSKSFWGSRSCIKTIIPIELITAPIL